MKLDLDPEFLRTSMDLWRQAVDMEIPIHDSLRMHFFSRRSELLTGFVKTAGHWSMVLNACKATGEDLAQLEAIKNVQAFKNWAQSGLNELSLMGKTEVLKDQIEGLEG